MSKEYKICTKCVMDTSDSNITFDENGVCDHCNGFIKNVKPNWHPNEKGKSILLEIVKDIKKKGKNRDFDSILGLSGGVDSSYLLHLAVKELKLRPLVFHVDGGWNSEIAVNNIEVMIKKLNLDLFTEVINWEEMKSLQLAFFKSGLPNIDIPQDHAFISTLYNFALKHDIKYILNGGNISTECVRNPLEFLYYGSDMRLIKDVINKFCDIELPTYPFSNILRHRVYLRYIKRIKRIKPLDLLEYNKEAAIKTLISEYGWKPYPQKHFESRFTKFFEGYWLPERFGFDTRKVQFSSLIQTGQMSRDEALNKLKKPSYNNESIKDEFLYISSKLGISIEELEGYFNMPKKFYWDYDNQNKLFNLGAKILQLIGVEKAIKR